MRGAVPPLPNMPLSRGAQLKHRGNFTFTFYVVSNRIRFPLYVIKAERHLKGSFCVLRY
jgi:hypothetical protein